MGITERKERQRAELREQILSAARRIVLEEGFPALTMRKIAEAIEYSPATIYLHFENREAIGRQLCAEAFEKLLSYMAPAAAIADPAERLRAIGRAYARYGFENPESYKLIFMTGEQFLEGILGEDEHGDGSGQRAFDLVVDAVREGVAQGVVAAQDPVLLAESIWAGIHGVVSLQLTCAKVLESPVDQIVETLVVALTRGIAP